MSLEPSSQLSYESKHQRRYSAAAGGSIRREGTMSNGYMDVKSWPRGIAKKVLCLLQKKYDNINNMDGQWK